MGSANAADIKEHTFKMAVVNAIDHPQGFGAQKFVEGVDKKSGGKIKIKIFPNGTLGGEQQVAAAMQGGVVDFSTMAPAQLVGTIKEFVVLDFPFSFATPAQADAVLDGPFGKKLMSYMPAKGWIDPSSLASLTASTVKEDNPDKPRKQKYAFSLIRVPLYLQLIILFTRL